VIVFGGRARTPPKTSDVVDAKNALRVTVGDLLSFVVEDERVSAFLRRASPFIPAPRETAPFFVFDQPGPAKV
jgi:hypothetical protein